MQQCQYCHARNMYVYELFVSFVSSHDTAVNVCRNCLGKALQHEFYPKITPATASNPNPLH